MSPFGTFAPHRTGFATSATGFRPSAGFAGARPSPSAGHAGGFRTGGAVRSGGGGFAGRGGGGGHR